MEKIIDRKKKIFRKKIIFKDIESYDYEYEKVLFLPRSAIKAAGAV